MSILYKLSINLYIYLQIMLRWYYLKKKYYKDQTVSFNMFVHKVTNNQTTSTVRIIWSYIIVTITRDNANQRYYTPV